MSERKQREFPAELADLAGQFLEWRQTRQVGCRIPDSMWESAVALARRFGVSRTAMALKLGYYELQKRVVGTSAPVVEATSARTPTFVELPSPFAKFADECVVEFQKASGTKMQLRLHAPSSAELVALCRVFWEMA